MDQQIKTEWVAALRSGEYKQGKSVLHNPDTNEWCCLGVLCDLADKQGILTNVETGVATMSVGHSATLYDGEGEFLPTAVCLWADLPSVPAVTAPHLFSEMPMPLPDLNDVREMTFHQIADLIERHL